MQEEAYLAQWSSCFSLQSRHRQCVQRSSYTVTPASLFIAFLHRDSRRVSLGRSHHETHLLSLCPLAAYCDIFFIGLWWLVIPHHYFCSFLERVCVQAQRCLTLCDPMDCSPPSCSAHGMFQARIREWVAISFSRGSSQPRNWNHGSCISCISRWILYPSFHLGSPGNQVVNRDDDPWVFTFFQRNDRILEKMGGRRSVVWWHVLVLVLRAGTSNLVCFGMKFYSPAWFSTACLWMAIFNWLTFLKNRTRSHILPVAEILAIRK